MIFREKLWDVVEVDTNKARRLAEELRLSPLVTSVLLGRGIDNADAMREFLFGKPNPYHDPFLMRDMDKACDRLERALASGEKITVFGDYDVDGITATSVLWKYLKSRGANVDYYIPQRKNEGYGLNSEAMRVIADKGTTLLITVDCGISGNKEIAERPQGLDVIVTDHHTVPEELPAAVAVLDPHRSDCAYPFKDLSGVGVAFKVCQALEQRQGREWSGSLEFVAMGTVADIVPLVDENREIVRNGLKAIAESPSLGLKELIKHTMIGDKAITAENIAFTLAPRLNAVGRLGSAQQAVELLTTDDGVRAHELAGILDSENFERQQISSEILEEAEAMLAAEEHIDTAILLRSPKWHQGVIGIVASRLVEKYHLPTILFSESEGVVKGSCRSIAPLNIYEALQATKDYVLQFGGHRQAAGLTLKAENFEAFKSAFKDYVARTLKPEDYRQQQRIDLVLRDEEITVRDVKDLALLEPYGCENSVPVFAYRGARIKNYRIVGAKANHLIFDVARGDSEYRAVMWNNAELADVMDSSGTVADITFQPKLNNWNDEVTVQLHMLTLTQHPAIYDLRRSSEPKKNFLEDVLRNESNLALFTKGDKTVLQQQLAEQLGNNAKYIHCYNYDEEFSGSCNVVVCYDLPPVDLGQFVHKLRSQKINNLVLLYNNEEYKDFVMNHPDINSMRGAYLFLREHFDKCGSFDYVQNIKENQGLSVVMVKILEELGLVVTEGNFVKDVLFKKVDIASSQLFQECQAVRKKLDGIYQNNERVSRYEVLRQH